jgi:KaiC/GvpD/RAD55 family RecA-like ATPase
VEVEAYLKSKNWNLRKAPGEHQTQCPFCGDKNKAGHLYVNRDHGAFMCHRCGESGSFYDLQVKLGDRPEPAIKDMADKWAVWSDVVVECQDALLEAPEALAYLRERRGLRAETIGKYKLGWAPKDLMDRLLKRWTLGDLRHAGLVADNNYPIFWDRLLVPYFQRDHVVTLRGKALGGNMLQAKDTSIHLFGVDNVRGHSEVYICEGELDAMYLDQLGYPACAIPGALNFQEHWATWFDDAKRIFVVLDADEAGRKGATKIQTLLGRRARIVEFPVPHGQETTDVTEYFLRDLHTKDDFEQLIDRARGQRLFTFKEGIIERDDLLTREGLRLGWPDLDYAISPGLLPGQIVTVLAKTGAGKTAFLTQVIHNLSSWSTYDDSDGGPGIPVLFLSLEQTKAEIMTRLERTAGLFNSSADADEIDRWYCKLRICDENKIPSTDVPHLIDEFIDDVGEPPRMVIVDYMGYWARAFKAKSKYEQVSEAVMELKRLAKDFGTTVLSPHQVSRLGRVGQRLEMDFARDSGVVEETSDFVFSLYRPGEGEEEEDAQRRMDVRLEILKSRHGNVGKQVLMAWAPYSLALVPRGGRMEKSVKAEWILKDAQADYGEVLRFHKGLRGLY